jgi:drug/metabolite transporter (DMT)-like permease
MHNDLLIAILGGLGAMLGWGFADFFAKKTIDKVGDVVSLAWAHLLGTSIFLVVALYQVIFLGKVLSMPASIGGWMGVAFFGVLQAAVYLFAYKGFGKGQIAVLNPVFASYPGVTALLSLFFFGEVFHINLLLPIIVIFLGILLLNLDIKGLRSKKLNIVPGLKEVGIAAFLAAFWTLGWSKFSNNHDYIAYALCMYTFMTISVFVFAKATKVKLKFSQKGIWPYLFLIGFCETIAYLSLTYGFSFTKLTSIVAVISGSFSLPTILLARIFLKEKVTAIQTVGTVVIILGIIFLSIN